MDNFDNVVIPTMNAHTAELKMLRANGETNRDNVAVLTGRVTDIASRVTSLTNTTAEWLSNLDDDSLRHDAGIRDCQDRLAILEAQRGIIAYASPTQQTATTVAQSWTTGQKALVITTILTLASAAIFLLRLL